jgi:hypothetical protein
LFAAGKEKWPNTGYNPAGIIIIRDYITVMLTGGYIHPVVVTDTFMRKQLKYHPVAIIAYNACRCEAACILPLFTAVTEYNHKGRCASGFCRRQSFTSCFSSIKPFGRLTTQRAGTLHRLPHYLSDDAAFKNN